MTVTTALKAVNLNHLLGSLTFSRGMARFGGGADEMCCWFFDDMA
jgi:hypothetical protein